MAGSVKMGSTISQRCALYVVDVITCGRASNEPYIAPNAELPENEKSAGHDTIPPQLILSPKNPMTAGDVKTLNYVTGSN